MRYLKIKLDVTDENYIFIHRKIRQLMDSLTEENQALYTIRSWRYIEND